MLTGESRIEPAPQRVLQAAPMENLSQWFLVGGTVLSAATIALLSDVAAGYITRCLTRRHRRRPESLARRKTPTTKSE